MSREDYSQWRDWCCRIFGALKCSLTRDILEPKLLLNIVDWLLKCKKCAVKLYRSSGKWMYRRKLFVRTLNYIKRSLLWCVTVFQIILLMWCWKIYQCAQIFYASTIIFFCTSVKALERHSSFPSVLTTSKRAISTNHKKNIYVFSAPLTLGNTSYLYITICTTIQSSKIEYYSDPLIRELVYNKEIYETRNFSDNHYDTKECNLPKHMKPYFLRGKVGVKYGVSD